MNERVGVILLNWNGGEFTEPCVNSLLRSEVPLWKILIIDNGSVDGSGERLVAKYPALEHIKNEKNIGFTGGNNQGMSRLMELGADYIWVLNNDTVVDPHCLGNMLAAARAEGNIGAITGKILYQDSPDKVWYGGATWNAFSFRAKHKLTSSELIGPGRLSFEVPFISGCCMLIPRTVLEKLGQFNDKFFIYYEDLDWCLRARDQGLKLLCVPSAILAHGVSASVRKTVTKSGGTASPLVHYLGVRNHLYVVRLHSKRPHQLIVAGFLSFLRLLWLTLGMALLRRWDKIASVWKGYFHGITLSPLPVSKE